MAHRIRFRRFLVGVVIGCALQFVSVASGQEATVPTVHWAYASYFGTAWYEISDQQSALIANLAPTLRTGEVARIGADDGKAVYSIRMPLTVGVTRLDFEDVPVAAKLSFRPSVQLSYGTVLGESEYAWTYRGDIRGRYTFRSGDLDWALIAAAGLVGYDANRGNDDSFTYAAIDYCNNSGRQASSTSKPSSMSSSLIVRAGRKRMTLPLTPQDSSASPCS
jgi:hypothetical protein